MSLSMHLTDASGSQAAEGLSGLRHAYLNHLYDFA